MSETTLAIIDRSQFFRDGLRQNLSSQRDLRLIDCDPDNEPLQFIDANSVGYSDNHMRNSMRFNVEFVNF